MLKTKVLNEPGPKNAPHLTHVLCPWCTALTPSSAGLTEHFAISKEGCATSTTEKLELHLPERRGGQGTSQISRDLQDLRLVHADPHSALARSVEPPERPPEFRPGVDPSGIYEIYMIQMKCILNEGKYLSLCEGFIVFCITDSLFWHDSIRSPYTAHSRCVSNGWYHRDLTVFGSSIKFPSSNRPELSKLNRAHANFPVTLLEESSLSSRCFPWHFVPGSDSSGGKA